MKLSNIITEKARTEIWLYSRALNGIQSITDGFNYQPSNVFAIRKAGTRERNPSLKTLSDLRLLRKHKYVEQIQLGKKEWANIFENKDMDEFKKLDELATKHLEDFLSNYGLEMNYVIAHKLKHISYKLFYCKKGHYLLFTINDEEILKFRGIDPNFKSNDNPYYAMAKNVIGSGMWKWTIPLTFEVKKKNSLADYLTSLQLGVKNKEIKPLIPGLIRTEIQRFHFNNLDMPYRTIEEYHYRQKNVKDYTTEIVENVEHGFEIKIYDFENDRKFE